MSPDNFQQAWQSHLSQTHVSVNADLLLKEVQNSHQEFRRTILGRDLTEICVSVVMLPLWIYLGVRLALPWTWYLTIPAFLWGMIFLMVDRRRHPQKAVASDEPLLVCVKESVAQVEHQIWLLRNVFWWYLLPFFIPLIAFFVHITWQSSDAWWEFYFVTFFMVLVVGGLYGWIYWLNQRAVQTQLEPRRQDLLALIASLNEEDEIADNVTVPVGSLPPTRSVSAVSPARIVIGVLAFVLFAGLLIAGAAFMVEMQNRDKPTAPSMQNVPQRLPQQRLRANPGSPVAPTFVLRQKSPFTAVRWGPSLPEVRVDETWYRLVSLNGIPAGEIVAFSRRIHEGHWRKRFEEDLTDLLETMKRPAEETVTLQLQSLTSPPAQIRKVVLMTHENRKAVVLAALERSDAAQLAEQPDSGRSAITIDDREAFRERVDEFLRLAQVNAGFSGVVAVAEKGELIYDGAYGVSSLESRLPNSMETPFRTGALSQTFVSAAIFRLETDGALNVDDPVYHYLPAFESERYREITIHHLLTHTSGLPHLPELRSLQRRRLQMSRKATPLEEYVALAATCPLDYPAGEQVMYSGLGYRLLSAIIERVSGQAFADFMEERIFQPHGLQQTYVARIAPSSQEAVVAESVSGVLRPLPNQRSELVVFGKNHNFGTEFGNAGISTSVRDLLKWDRVLADNTLLSAEQKKRMLTPVRQQFASGWIVERSGPDGKICQSNTGAHMGQYCRMIRVPGDDRVVIVLSNIARTEETKEMLTQLFLLCRSLPYRDLLTVE